MIWEIHPSPNGWRVRNMMTGKDVVNDVTFFKAVQIKRGLEISALNRAASMSAGN